MKWSGAFGICLSWVVALVSCSPPGADTNSDRAIAGGDTAVSAERLAKVIRTEYARKEGRPVDAAYEELFRIWSPIGKTGHQIVELLGPPQRGRIHGAVYSITYEQVLNSVHSHGVTFYVECGNVIGCSNNGRLIEQEDVPPYTANSARPLHRVYKESDEGGSASEDKLEELRAIVRRGAGRPSEVRPLGRAFREVVDCWNPIGRTVEEVKECFGQPQIEDTNKLRYYFTLDEGHGEYFTFEVNNGRVYRCEALTS